MPLKTKEVGKYMKKVKIAILGFGNVGKGVWKILERNKEEIIKNSGYQVEVGKILVKDVNKVRKINVSEKLLTDRFEDILNDDGIEIVVEVIGGESPAKDYIVRSMKAKKHVVTANKLLLASYLKELLHISREEKVSLYYEASVGGGIPIIREINESLTGNKIKKITGILNGTTNYILSKMTSEGVSFQEALIEAQEKGYAEVNPTSDVEGEDAAFKLAIVASLAFGTKIIPKDIYRQGISNITTADIDFAKKYGYAIKLLALAKEESENIEVKVHPALITNSHPMANVDGVFNSVYIEGNAVGELMLSGKGAGELPTGSAIVGDIISILRNTPSFKKEKDINSNGDKVIRHWKENESEFYIRVNVVDKPGVMGEIATIFGDNNISIESVTQDIKKEGNVSLVFITYKGKEEHMGNSIERIKESKVVNRVESVLRVENFN